MGLEGWEEEDKGLEIGDGKSLRFTAKELLAPLEGGMGGDYTAAQKNSEKPKTKDQKICIHFTKKQLGNNG